MPGPESTSPIRLDQSRSLIVIYCTDHEWYRASRFHRDEALDAACAHEEREHVGDTRHREARRQRRRVATAQTPSTYEPGRKV